MRSEPSRFLEAEKVYKRAPTLGKRFHISKGDKLPHTDSQQRQIRGLKKVLDKLGLHFSSEWVQSVANKLADAL
jgi:hypothetical protein